MKTQDIVNSIQYEDGIHLRFDDGSHKRISKFIDLRKEAMDMRGTKKRVVVGIVKDGKIIKESKPLNAYQLHLLWYRTFVKTFGEERNDRQ